MPLQLPGFRLPSFENSFSPSERRGKGLDRPTPVMGDFVVVILVRLASFYLDRRKFEEHVPAATAV
jgi:hypothetical protein